jgi:hypothetical protein
MKRRLALNTFILIFNTFFAWVLASLKKMRICIKIIIKKKNLKRNIILIIKIRFQIKFWIYSIQINLFILKIAK